MKNSKRINVLYTIPNFITAGSGQVLFNIASRLDRKLYEPTICVLKKGGTRLEKEIEARGISLLEAPFCVSAKPYYSLPARLLKLAQFFKNKQIDIWHSFHYTDDYTEPLIAKLSGAKAWVYTKTNMLWKSRAWFLRSLFSNAIVLINSDMKGIMFNKLLSFKKTVHIPIGIDKDIFKANRKSSDVLSQYNNQPGEIVIGNVSNLMPIKGHDTLIKAMRLLPSNMRLFIVGRSMSEAHDQYLVRTVAENKLEGRVIFLGKLDLIVEFLNAIDIFAFPTKGEGLGVVLLEAMACERPCVASNAIGPKDIIQDGINGYLVPPENPLALAEKIKILAESEKLKSKLGAAARQRILDHYTIEREVADHERLYEELMK